jgi:hypothetical protein
LLSFDCVDEQGWQGPSLQVVFTGSGTGFGAIGRGAGLIGREVSGLRSVAAG